METKEPPIKIPLDFLPNLVVFFRKDKNYLNTFYQIWGDEVFFNSINIYIEENLIKNFNSGWVFIEKKTLKHKIFTGI